MLKIKIHLNNIRETIKEEDGKKKFSEDYKTKLEELNKTLPEVSVRSVVDHIEHVIKVTGNANHVGLGSDFDGAGSYPQGLDDVTGYPLITYHLLKRGYCEDDIMKILGGNLLRVFEHVTKTAKVLKKSH